MTNPTDEDDTTTTRNCRRSRSSWRRLSSKTPSPTILDVDVIDEASAALPVGESDADEDADEEQAS